MQPATNDPDVLELYVGFDRYESDRLVLQMAPELVDEVLALLDEHGLEHGSVLVASAGQQLWVETVSIIGATGGVAAALASIINTLIRRHDNKRILLEPPNGTKIELQGYPPKEVERFLQKRMEERNTPDGEIDRMLGVEDEPN